jgi:hypothetical protein
VTNRATEREVDFPKKMRGNAFRNGYVAAIEGIHRFSPTREEVVARAAGFTAFGDRGGDCVYPHVHSGAFLVPVPLK